MAGNLFFILLSFMVAGWVQGTLGFGFAVVSTLLLINGLDFTTLVFLNLCMALLTCLIPMFSVQNLKAVQKPVLVKLIVSALVGIVVAIIALHHVNAAILKQITLLVILMASLLSLGRYKNLFSHKYICWAGGFLSGVLTPSTGINGPLVMLYLNAALKDKRQIRATMLSYLLVIMASGILSLNIQPGLSPDTWSKVLQVTPPTVIGYVLGVVTFQLLSNSVYQKVVSFFLIGSSLLSLIYLVAKF